MARKPEAGSEVKREDVGKGKEKGEEKRGEKKKTRRKQVRRGERRGVDRIVRVWIAVRGPLAKG